MRDCQTTEARLRECPWNTIEGGFYQRGGRRKESAQRVSSATEAGGIRSKAIFLLSLIEENVSSENFDELRPSSNLPSEDSIGVGKTTVVYLPAATLSRVGPPVAPGVSDQ